MEYFWTLGQTSCLYIFYLPTTFTPLSQACLWQSFILFFFSFILEKEKVCVCKQGRGRGRERESQADSALSVEPDKGLDLTSLRSWPEPKSRAGCLTDWATQAPHCLRQSFKLMPKMKSCPHFFSKSKTLTSKSRWVRPCFSSQGSTAIHIINVSCLTWLLTMVPSSWTEYFVKNILCIWFHLLLITH